MDYEQIDYDLLEKCGETLKNPYQDKEFNVKLFNGLVYKLFPEEVNVREIERVLLKLERYHLDGIMETKKILTNQGKVIGYAYPYSLDPLLKEKLDSLTFKQKIFYIQELIHTHTLLAKKGLVHTDYHTCNVLVGSHTTLIDVDSIKREEPYKRFSSNMYFLDLIISIFTNFDLTFFDDNSNIYAFISQYFHDRGIITGGRIHYLRILEQMKQKDKGQIIRLREKVKELSL